MKQDTRLDKIERLLTPNQAVILWLQEIQHIEMRRNICDSFVVTPRVPGPYYKITKQIYQTIRDSMKNQPQQLWKMQFVGQQETSISWSNSTTRLTATGYGRKSVEPDVRCTGREPSSYYAGKSLSFSSQQSIQPI